MVAAFSVIGSGSHEFESAAQRAGSGAAAVSALPAAVPVGMINDPGIALPGLNLRSTLSLPRRPVSPGGDRYVSFALWCAKALKLPVSAEDLRVSSWLSSIQLAGYRIVPR